MSKLAFTVSVSRNVALPLSESLNDCLAIATPASVRSAPVVLSLSLPEALILTI